MTGIPVSVGELVDVATINSWARGYLRKNTAKAVNGTTAATDLLNGEFTLPAGAMATDRILRLTAWGDWKNGAASNQDIPEFQLVFGGSTLIDTDIMGSAVAIHGATRYGWRIVAEIQNLGAANSQQAYLTGVLNLESADANSVDSQPFVTGNGAITLITNLGLATPGKLTLDGGNSGAVDTTASCALALKVKNANSSANYETKLLGALVEII